MSAHPLEAGWQDPRGAQVSSMVIPRGSGKLAARLVEATSNFAAEELSDLCASEGSHWNNLTDRKIPFKDWIHLVERERHHWRQFGLERVTTTLTEAGFVVQMTVRGVLADGQALTVPVCLVGHVKDGLIQRLDEYVNGVALKGLLRLLAAEHDGVQERSSPQMTPPPDGGWHC